jgi:hypothetical protein
LEFPVTPVEAMKELIRTNDPVFLTWIQAILAENGIEAVVFDQYTSAVEGSIGALPRRVMVLEDDLIRAKRLIASANSGAAP